MSSSTEDKYRRMIELFGTMYALLNVERGWCFFREEMFNDSQSGENAAAFNEFCMAFCKENPDIYEDIKPLLKELSDD